MDNQEIKLIFEQSESKVDLARKLNIEYSKLNNNSLNKKLFNILSDAGIIKSLEDLSVKSFSERRKQRYMKHPSFCKKCGRELSYSQRHNSFCSNHCAASYNNTKRILSEKTKSKISNTLKKHFLESNKDGQQNKSTDKVVVPITVT